MLIPIRPATAEELSGQSDAKKKQNWSELYEHLDTHGSVVLMMSYVPDGLRQGLYHHYTRNGIKYSTTKLATDEILILKK